MLPRSNGTTPHQESQAIACFTLFKIGVGPAAQADIIKPVENEQKSLG